MFGAFCCVESLLQVCGKEFFWQKMKSNNVWDFLLRRKYLADLQGCFFINKKTDLLLI